MTVTEVVPQTGRRPATIRLRPAPPCDPPFDDELSPEIWAPPDQLAFEWPAAPDAPGPVGGVADGTSAAGAGAAGGVRAAGGLRARADGPGSSGGLGASGGPGTSGGPGASGGASTSGAGGGAGAGGAVGPGDGTAGGAGDARRAVRRFVHLAVEVLNGHRPAAQLRRLAHPMDASRVVAQAVTGAHRVNQMRRTASVHRPSPVAVRGLHLCEPRSGAVEAAVLLETGERTWAMALRLELHHEGWAATVLRLI